MDARYAQLAEEMKKLQARQAELEKKLEMGVNAARKASEEGARSAAESVWADVFSQTVANSPWLTDKTFSPGRWALGYQALYVLFRALSNVKPMRILGLGFGQSARMITQYATTDSNTEHYVVEHNQEWISFFKRNTGLLRTQGSSN